MRNIQLKISESDFQKYKLDKGEIKFTDLVEKISLEYARKAVLECNQIATQTGLSEMSLEEIKAEINAVRNEKKQ